MCSKKDLHLQYNEFDVEFAGIYGVKVIMVTIELDQIKHF